MLVLRLFPRLDIDHLKQGAHDLHHHPCGLLVHSAYGFADLVYALKPVRCKVDQIVRLRRLHHPVQRIYKNAHLFLVKRQYPFVERLVHKPPPRADIVHNAEIPLLHQPCVRIVLGKPKSFALHHPVIAFRV